MARGSDGGGRIGVALTAISMGAAAMAYVVNRAASDSEAIAALRAQAAALTEDVRSLRAAVADLSVEIGRLSAISERPKPRTTPTKR